ncbi:helix-turn-helix domain-containing protein [Seonamhaeicola marinus]|uniref:AraC family transcriptional regulator n=1 Tax=Seonamhaeicola marinus TaxID=1912246 RepID=A0A5D0HLB7_9FLAO|nr:helix-turn-helix domain-containing protein [Seonamhaeicola marinus]TYA71770.1 AraC family transcriptional regulator [Seonamhaeicola marinus]
MEYKIEIIESIGKIVVFIMIVLSFFLFTAKSKNQLPNRLFGIYLLVIAFDLIGLFTNKTLEYPFIQNLKTASSLLQLPLFYLYVLSVCYNNFRIRPKHLVHGLPFLAFFIVFSLSGVSEKIIFFYQVIGEFQFFSYIIAVFAILRKYRAVYLENYSNASYAIYRWLFQINVLSCLAHTLVLLRWIFSSSSLQSYVLNLNILISLSVLCIITFFVLKALYQPQLFTGINKNIYPLDTPPKKKVNKKGTTTNEAQNQSLETLNTFMITNKPYLDFDLTLQKLAELTDIPEKELSELINRYLGKHFFDFINEYRINDAKILLADATKNDLTVQEILYTVGFNSKSSFYTAFKKVTNLTPSEFRKSIL